MRAATIILSIACRSCAIVCVLLAAGIEVNHEAFSWACLAGALWSERSES